MHERGHKDFTTAAKLLGIYDDICDMQYGCITVIFIGCHWIMVIGDRIDGMFG